MQMCEVVANGEVVYSLFAIFVAIVDMYLGFPVFKQSVLALRGESSEQPQGRDIGEPDKEEEDDAAKYNQVNDNSAHDTNNEVELEPDQSTNYSGNKNQANPDEWKKNDDPIV